VRRAIYPGTFDPVTLGHIDLMERALRIFGELVVAVSASPGKRPLFSLEERVAQVRAATVGMRQLEVVGFGGLLVDLVRAQRAHVLIKGLRALSDFEYEFQMALMNRKLDPDLETAFLMPSEKYTYLNSTVVKELATLGGDLGGLVPPVVEEALRQRFGPQGAPRPADEGGPGLSRD